MPRPPRRAPAVGRRRLAERPQEPAAVGAVAVESAVAHEEGVHRAGGPSLRGDLGAHGITASLCGIGEFAPAKPAAAMPATNSASRAGGTSIAAYSQSIPSSA